MKKLNECKTFKEIVLNIDDKYIDKIAYFSTLLYVLIPIFILFTNIFIKESASMYLYIGLFICGGLGLLNGIIYLLKKIYLKRITKKKVIPIIIIILFLIWCFISCLLSKNKEYAFLGTSYRFDGYLTYIMYLGFFINGFIISHNKDNLKKLLNCLIISSSLLCILILMNNGLTEVLLKRNNNMTSNIYTGFTYNLNHFAYYLSITVIASIACFLNSIGIKKLLYLCSYIIQTIVLIRNDTFASFLAILITIIIMLIYSLIIKKNRIYMFVILLSILIVPLTFKNVNDSFNRLINEIVKIHNNKDNLYTSINDDEQIENSSDLIICAGNSRLDLWLKGIDLIKNKPLFGYGIENLEEPYSYIVMCDSTDRPHNIFIQIGATTGIVGLILYVSFLSIVFVNIIIKYKLINKEIMIFVFMTISYLISLFFGNSMFYTTPYYMISLGVIFSVYYIERNKLNDRKKN